MPLCILTLQNGSSLFLRRFSLKTDYLFRVSFPFKAVSQGMPDQFSEDEDCSPEAHGHSSGTWLPHSPEDFKLSCHDLPMDNLFQCCTAL